MITITPLTEVTLKHRAHEVAVAESGHIAAVSRAGAGTLLAPDHITGTSFRLAVEARDVTLSATGSLLAAVVRGGLVVLSSSTFRPVYSEDDSFESACFRPDGTLWTVTKAGEDVVVLEVREPKTWRVVARTEFTDPFGDSFFRVLPHPYRDHVAICAAAGQDGQCFSWAHRQGAKIAVARFPGLDATTLPSFTPSGDRFLAIADCNELRLYSFPAGPLRATMQWPFDEMDNQIGDYVSFVDANRALANSLAERLYLVDVRKMAIAEEISLRSDLRYFAPLPTGGFFSVHNQNSRDTILTWLV